MKNMLLILLSCMALQSCFVNAKRDYNGYSKTLVFTKQDKWLINNIYTDLNSYDRDELNKEVFSLFNELSSGNIYNLEKAKSQNIITGRIPFSPETEDIEQFKNSTDFFIELIPEIESSHKYICSTSFNLSDNSVELLKHNSYVFNKVLELSSFNTAAIIAAVP